MFNTKPIDCFETNLNDKWPFYDHFWPFYVNPMDIFHKTEVQTVILRCLTSLNLNWYKSYDTKRKNARNANECFCTKSQKNRNGNICILCHNFWTKQNLDPLSTSKWLSEHTVGQKMARNARILKYIIDIYCASEYTYIHMYLHKSPYVFFYNSSLEMIICIHQVLCKLYF